MALLRDIVLKTPPTLLELIAEEISKLNLKAVKRVTIRFDPFRDDVAEFRHFSNLLHAEDTLKSNLKCILKTEILTDRSEQTAHFELNEGQQFLFKCGNLKCLEIYKLMNEHITPLAVEEVEVPKTAKKMVQKMIKKK